MKGTTRYLLMRDTVISIAGNNEEPISNGYVCCGWMGEEREVVSSYYQVCTIDDAATAADFLPDSPKHEGKLLVSCGVHIHTTSFRFPIEQLFFNKFLPEAGNLLLLWSHSKTQPILPVG